MLVKGGPGGDQKNVSDNDYFFILNKKCKYHIYDNSIRLILNSLSPSDTYKHQ